MFVNIFYCDDMHFELISFILIFFQVAEHYATRRRVPTPVKNDSTWFKSLTRRSKQKV